MGGYGAVLGEVDGRLSAIGVAAGPETTEGRREPKALKTASDPGVDLQSSDSPPGNTHPAWRAASLRRLSGLVDPKHMACCLVGRG